MRKLLKLPLLIALLLTVITVVAGCSAGETQVQTDMPVIERPPIHVEPAQPPVRPITVSSIEIIVEETTMPTNTRFVPVVVVYPEDAEDISYTLHSTDERIARPGRGAWVTFEAGRVELVATAANGVTGRLILNVTLPVTAIELETDNITLGLGASGALRYTVLPLDATDRSVTFVSRDENIVTVSPRGVIAAVGIGETSVDIISSCGIVTATAEITVVVPVEEVTLLIARSNLAVGDMLYVEITVYPENAGDIDISLTASNANVSISNSRITAVSAGAVTITASAPNGVYAVFEMNIVDLEEFAREILRLTNEIRFDYNLLGFTQNDALTAAAVVRAHESSVVFSHTRPDGRGPFTAFTESGVIFARAAENLAAGQTTPEMAVNGWMNSPGHRANIVNADLYQMGVAVIMNDAGRLYWVQTFTD